MLPKVALALYPFVDKVLLPTIGKLLMKRPTFIANGFADETGRSINGGLKAAVEGT